MDGILIFSCFVYSMQDIYLSQHPLASNGGRNSCMDSAVHRKDAQSSWLLNLALTQLHPKVLALSAR